VQVFSFSQTKFEPVKNQNKSNKTKSMEKKIITSTHAPAPIGPYSHANLTGNTLYVSGQVAKDAITGEMVQSDIKAETRKVMENILAN